MNIGDYVRTKTGIHKIFRINENATSWKYHCDKKSTGEWDSFYEYIKIRAEDIIKSSPNIIDLIEEGDYVNGYKVLNVYYDEVIESVRVGIDHQIIKDYTNQDIKSIVTKEQIEQMEYKVGE